MSGNNLQTTPNNLSTSGNIIKIDPILGGSIDLSGLPEAQRNELMTRYGEEMIRLGVKAAETRIDIAGLDGNLQSVNENVNKATQGGYNMQAEQTITTSYGKTTVIVGNTQRAASGKVSGTISGESNNLVKIVVIIAIAVVLAAIFLR